MKPTPTALNGSSRSVNARLADVEPTVEALLTRCDELLLAGKALAARVADLEAVTNHMTLVRLIESVTEERAFQVDELQRRTVILSRSTIGDRLKWLLGIIRA